MAGRPLPVGVDDMTANSGACYLDENGGIVYRVWESAVEVSYVSIVVQGLR